MSSIFNEKGAIVDSRSEIPWKTYCVISYYKSNGRHYTKFYETYDRARQALIEVRERSPQPDAVWLTKSIELHQKHHYTVWNVETKEGLKCC